jgi:hypothetical protein
MTRPAMQEGPHRPGRRIAAAIRAAAKAGMEIEVKPDGTIIARPVSPLSTKPKVAPPKEIVL